MKFISYCSWSIFKFWGFWVKGSHLIFFFFWGQFVLEGKLLEKSHSIFYCFDHIFFSVISNWLSFGLGSLDWKNFGRSAWRLHIVLPCPQRGHGDLFAERRMTKWRNRSCDSFEWGFDWRNRANIGKLYMDGICTFLMRFTTKIIIYSFHEIIKDKHTFVLSLPSRVRQFKSMLLVCRDHSSCCFEWPLLWSKENQSWPHL